MRKTTIFAIFAAAIAVTAFATSADACGRKNPCPVQQHNNNHPMRFDKPARFDRPAWKVERRAERRAEQNNNQFNPVNRKAERRAERHNADQANQFDLNNRKAERRAERHDTDVKPRKFDRNGNPVYVSKKGKTFDGFDRSNPKATQNDAGLPKWFLKKRVASLKEKNAKLEDKNQQLATTNQDLRQEKRSLRQRTLDMQYQLDANRYSGSTVNYSGLQTPYMYLAPYGVTPISSFELGYLLGTGRLPVAGQYMTLGSYFDNNNDAVPEHRTECQWKNLDEPMKMDDGRYVVSACYFGSQAFYVQYDDQSTAKVR